MAWDHGAGRLWVVFNRDEQRTRPPSLPLEFADGPHGKIACSTDPEGGGTWFAASSPGFGTALLNHHPIRPYSPGERTRSRGLLVGDLAVAPDRETACRVLMAADLTVYRPFHLFLFSPEGVSGWTWDGHHLAECLPEGRFLATSSFDPEAVGRYRHGLWREAVSRSTPGGEEAAAIMRQGDPGFPAAGLTMDREDARTVSQILLEMDPAGFRFSLRMREPEGHGYGEPQLLVHP